jgi:CRISPR-associated protein Csd1
MILQALKEYYDRKPDLPRIGWEMKAVPFLLLISENGEFIGFQDTRGVEGKTLRAKEFLVPCLGEKKGNGIKSNLFWENIEYLLGIPVPTESKRIPNVKRVQEQHTEFKRRISSINGNCSVLNAVRTFLTAFTHTQIQNDSLWQTVFKLNQVVLLAIEGRGPVTDDPELRLLIDASRESAGTHGRCLITGTNDEITSLEPPIRGVRDANSTGASLVSINNKITSAGNTGKAPAFASFMKEQGYNSPIGKTASFAYTTALNFLLRKDQRQKIQVGDATTVFWSAKKTQFEIDAFLFFGDIHKDDPDMNSEAIIATYASVWNGTYVIPDDPSLFFVLGLAPNVARLSVRYWEVGTVRSIGRRLQQHILDLSIEHDNSYTALPLKRLLCAIAAQGEDNNIPSNLAGATMRAVLEGTPYPQTLLQAAIRRIKAEQSAKDKKTRKQAPNVTYPRAALIKACLNRAIRFTNPTHERELTVSLDITNAAIGYRLGRLFAVLEKIQKRANPGINATIRDRFYGAASSTPVTVFGNLMRLKNHHLAKLDHVGERINYEKLIGEIMSGIGDFPTHLALDQQGRFAIGYYHQRQDFFTKKTDKE